MGETVNHTPTCEIITIGSELLLGQIMDTNTAYLAQELNRAGAAVRYRTAVGDRLDEIVEVLGRAKARCDMVITTGGLGPTLDDLTREAVARVTGTVLEFRQALMDQIEAIFERVGYRMPENNRRQAYVPAGSLAISNPVGTAPAFIKETDGGPIISLPGVPRELKYLVGHEVIPWLQERFELSRQGLTYRVLKVVGIGESKVDRIIGDLIGTGEDPEVGLMASMGEIKIRIAARAGDRGGAESIIAPVEREIRSRLGRKVFGQDEETLESVIEALLQIKGFTLGLLETFTGGMAALRFNQLPSSQLLEARVVLQEDRVARMLPEGGRGDGDEIAMMMACMMRDEAGADAGLAVLGFPEKTGKGLILKGNAAAVAEGSEKRFSWEMGGDLLTLQVRGTIIGLNTLRLTLLNSS